ncbi:MAG: hypothetical protein CL908_05195 [Deltaproteobacteria bacterium]|nr:hypothetical protein [Deltaproteobacteria bacterium]
MFEPGFRVGGSEMEFDRGPGGCGIPPIEPIAEHFDSSVHGEFFESRRVEEEGAWIRAEEA